MSLTTLVDNSTTDKNTLHSYLHLYDVILAPRRKTAEIVLEIGVRDGGSIDLWQKYFTRAAVHGVEISTQVPAILQSANSRVCLHMGADAYSNNFVNTLPPVLDVVLDDGPHTIASMVACINLYAPRLAPEGVLIIEDVQSPEWFDVLTAAVPVELAGFVRKFDLRATKGRYDDLVFVIDKSL